MSYRLVTVPAMGWFALVMAALAAAVSGAAPGRGLFLGMGLGILAATCGGLAYGRRQDPGAVRLAGAGALAVGLLAILIAFTRYGLALAAIQRLERLFS